MVVATNSTHTKVVHTNIVYVVVATNSTHVPHEVLAEAPSQKNCLFLPPIRGSHPGTLLPSRLLHAVASCALLAQLVLLYTPMKEAQKFVCLYTTFFCDPTTQ